jgi:hypothetical protein
VINDAQPADTLEDTDRPGSSAVILEALDHAEREFRDYNELCRRVDAIYSTRATLGAAVATMDLTDQEYDTFWASMEVLKPAIYAKSPQVVAKPRFSDATATDKVVAELLERVVNSEFERNNLDMHLREVRDDMALLNRGVLWVTYESDGGDKRICVDHVDRLDYRHEPVRYWPELGWEARCAWMTLDAMVKRFTKLDRETLRQASFTERRERHDDDVSTSAKAPIWEVWSKADNRVYWVTEGIDRILDEVAPHLDLRDFYPAPRPAYGTLKRRSLIPVPDYVRYQRHLDQINDLTARIYTLLERVRVVGLIPAGGDVGQAIETAMSENTTAMFIPVPGAAMTPGGSDYVQWLPIEVIANTITGLITARQQLFADFDRLSGISDIMRGETEADETLGAQRLKGQYGSVRVKDKTEEIVRLARDVSRVAVEIICEKFDQKTLLDISQMTIPSRKDVEHDIEEVKKAAKEELKALTNKAEQAMQQAQAQQQPGQPPHQPIDPQQAQAQLQQAQQQIGEKYAPQLQALQNTVVIEDVMKVIRDRRDRGLIIDIETDSTVMTDEIAEKQARTELLQAFTGAIQSMQPMFALGDAGAKLAVEIIRFTLQPYTRGNRQIQGALDELLEQAPEIAAKMAAQQDDGANDQLAKAQQTLAEAEQTKAQAAVQKVQADAAAAQAENQVKIGQLQLQRQADQEKFQHQMAQVQQKAQSSDEKHQQQMGKLQLDYADAQNDAALREQELKAQINLLTAQTAQILHQLGLDERAQDLDEYKATSETHARVVDQRQTAVASEREDARALSDQGQEQ